MNNKLLCEIMRKKQLDLFRRHEREEVFGIPIIIPSSSSRSYDAESVNNAIHDAFNENVPEYLILMASLSSIRVDESLISSGYNAKIDTSSRTLRIAPITDEKKMSSSICHELVHAALANSESFRNAFFSREMVQEYRKLKREIIARLISYRKKNIANHYSIDERWLAKVASETGYDKKFEDYLKNVVKLPFIFQIAGKVIPEPYMIVSLEEYICVGFQYFHFENRNVLENESLCHVLYSTLENYHAPFIHRPLTRKERLDLDKEMEIDDETKETMERQDKIEEEYPHWPAQDKKRLWASGW